MEDMIPCSVKDQEVFRRVWQRVMAGRDDAKCPLETLPPNLQGDLSCDCLEALIRQQGQNLPEECERQGGEENPISDGSAQEQSVSESSGLEVTATESPEQEQPGSELSNLEVTAPESPEQEQPAPGLPMEQLVPKPLEQEQPVPESPAEDQPVPECSRCAAMAEAEILPEADGPSRGNDLPQLWEEPQEATDRTARLRRQVMEALEGWQFYRHLARKARAGDARVLNSMAGELHRLARKLSAAYFLLTGLRYWPSELLSAPAIPSYWGALRTRHQAEQRQEAAYRMAADDWDDPNMQELYEELIESAQHRSRQLRGLLEQDISQ